MVDAKIRTPARGGKSPCCKRCHQRPPRTKRARYCAACVKAPVRRRKPRPQLKTMPYAAYLRTAAWALKRRRALARAGHRCQACNSTRQLDVHHRTYQRRGAEAAADLLVLCRACHDLFHQHRTLVTVAQPAHP